MGSNVLIATLGRTDLQAVVRDKSTGERFRVSFNDTYTRSIHRKLEEDINKNTILPMDFSKPSLNLSLGELKNNRISLNAEAQWSLDGTDNDRFELCYEKAGGILLSGTLLAKVLHILHRWISLPDCVVLLNTRRNETSKYAKGEPIAAGKLLVKWAAENLQLAKSKDYSYGSQPNDGVCVYSVTWHDILLNDEDFYERFDKGVVINQALMRRLNRILKKAAAIAEDSFALLADSGGIPGIKFALRNMVYWRFEGRVRVVPALEEVGKLPTPGDLKWWIPWEEELQERRRASELVQRGEFGAAWATVDPGERKSPEGVSRWRMALKAVSLYLNGFRDDSVQALAKSKLEFDPLRKLLEKNVPSCILPAMQVEAALWQGDHGVPEAAARTCLFTELCCLDVLNMKGLTNLISSSGTRLVVSEMDKAMQTMWMDRQPRREGRSLPRGDLNLGIVEQQVVSDYLMGKDNATESLRTLVYEMTDRRPTDKDDAPSDMRNKLVHENLSKKSIEGARRLFQARQLWDTDAIQQGRRFLAASLPGAVLQYLGYKNPERIYSDIVDSLLKMINEI